VNAPFPHVLHREIEGTVISQPHFTRLVRGNKNRGFRITNLGPIHGEIAARLLAEVNLNIERGRYVGGIFQVHFAGQHTYVKCFICATA